MRSLGNDGECGRKIIIPDHSFNVSSAFDKNPDQKETCQGENSMLIEAQLVIGLCSLQNINVCIWEGVWVFRRFYGHGYSCELKSCVGCSASIGQ